MIAILAFAGLSPTILLLGIAVLIVLLFALILWVLWRTKKKQEVTHESVDASQTEEAAPAEPETKPALVKVGEPQVTSSVSSAMRFVKENSAGPGGRYRTPWFLMVGASNSGKSTLLNHSGISLSLREGTTDFGVVHGIHWGFFDGGVLLDVPGEFFMGAEQTSSDEHKWKALLRNLTMRRPQRPIDGVVLTIPCTELFGDSAMAVASIGQRSAQIFNKLWQLQRWSGLSFPVYVVITKCDAIPGFKSLAQQLPAHYQREMFGWSNPYNVEAAFEPGWIDQGFEELVRQVNRLQCEVLVERQNIENADDVFLFSSKLLELRRPLRVYLGQIFKHSSYRESLQFRGFYFCGDASEVIEAVSEPPRALAVAASYSGAGDVFDATEPAITGEVLGLTTPSTEVRQAAPIFVTDLFESKIFPERGLARPVKTVRLTKNRWMLAAQAACLLTVLVLAIGMTINYRRLSETRNAFVTILDRLAPALEKVETAKASRSGITQLTRDEQDIADHLLRTVQSTSGYRFKTIFYPTSLAQPLDIDLENAMVPIFNNLVLPSFRQQLLEKSQQLLIANASAESCNKAPAYMRQLVAYQELCGFSADLVRLETNIHRYNRLARPSVGDIPSEQDRKDLSEVEKFLTKHPLPENFDKNPYFQFAFARSQGCQIGAGDLDGRQAEVRLKGLIQPFFEQWFTANPAVVDLNDAKKRINDLDEPQTQAHLEETKKLLEQIKSEVVDPAFAWMSKNQFELTPPLDEVTGQVISASGLFFNPTQQTNLKHFVETTGDRQFAAFTGIRSGEAADVIGNLLDFEGGGIQLSKNSEQLRSYLEKLLQQQFADKDNPNPIQASIAQLYWKQDVLQRAVKLPEQYEGFLKAALANVPDDLHELFDAIASFRLEAGIVNLVVEAESIQTLPSSEEERQNFQEAAPQLNTLLDQLHRLDSPAYDELLAVTTRQALHLLRGIDTAFEEQFPYRTNGDTFNRWNVENTPAWAFDAHNADELAEYVKAQRQQVQQYAAKAAPLVNFLQSQPSASPRGQVFTKWNGIVSDLQQYSSKAPGTSLKGLEDFIGVNVDKVTPDNCQADFLTTVSGGSSYFAQRQEHMRRTLLSRCRFLSQQNAVIAYSNIARLFNEQLAGKFPFSAPPQEQMPPEADPTDIAKLYGMLDNYGKSIRNGLEKGSFGDSYAQVLGFLNQMDDLRPVFGPLLSGQPNPVPSFDIIPVFRVNQGREINGNEIIDWTLQVGADSFHFHDPERTGRWNFGDPVRLVLRWAKDSPQQPASVRTANDTKLVSRTVVFEYRDSWALFRMIFLHRPAPNDFDRMVDPDPQTLVFTVADTKNATSTPSNGANSTPETKVFVRIKLRAPGKPDNLRFRSFPTEAPDLTQSQTSNARAGGNYQ